MASFRVNTVNTWTCKVFQRCVCVCVEVLVRPDEVVTRGFFRHSDVKTEAKNRNQLNG